MAAIRIPKRPELDGINRINRIGNRASRSVVCAGDSRLNQARTPLSPGSVRDGLFLAQTRGPSLPAAFLTALLIQPRHNLGFPVAAAADPRFVDIRQRHPRQRPAFALLDIKPVVILCNEQPLVVIDVRILGWRDGTRGAVSSHDNRGSDDRLVCVSKSGDSTKDSVPFNRFNFTDAVLEILSQVDACLVNRWSEHALVVPMNVDWRPRFSFPTPYFRESGTIFRVGRPDRDRPTVDQRKTKRRRSGRMDVVPLITDNNERLCDTSKGAGFWSWRIRLSSQYRRLNGSRPMRRAFAIWDRYPVSPGHALVIPRRLVATWFDADAQEQAALLELVNLVKQHLDATLKPKPDGYNVGFNAGEAAGQTVMHLHVHVIPRYAGDVEDPTGGVRHVIPDKANYLRGPDACDS